VAALADRRAQAVRCRAAWIQTGFKNILNGFKFAQILANSKGAFPLLQKLEIKYGWKEPEMGNKFSYINLSIFELNFELKFKEISMS
jgi:hypothetical protein